MIQEEIHEFIDNFKYFNAIHALFFKTPTSSIQSVCMSGLNPQPSAVSVFWSRPPPQTRWRNTWTLLICDNGVQAFELKGFILLKGDGFYKGALFPSYIHSKSSESIVNSQIHLVLNSSQILNPLIFFIRDLIMDN